LELRHLRYFIAVAEEGSFTRAAKRLRLAQQAVSRQIADLERELGVKLFERGARGARLTPAGVAFVDGAKGALGQTVRAIQLARAQSATGQLRLAYAYLTPAHSALVGEAVAHFHASRPNMGILVSHLPTATQAAGLRDGVIDVAFGYLPSAEAGEIVGDLIHDDPMIGVIIPARHPLATRQQLWLRDLASLPLLGISRELNPVAFDSIMAGLADRGLIPDLGIVQAVGIHAVSLVAQGDCWKLASETMIPEADAQPDVVYRRFADPPLSFGLWLRRVGQAASPMVQQFGAICRVMGTALGLRSKALVSVLALQNLGLFVQVQALL
jgi:DNA-binding transcriptional LysR family regulator